MAAEDIGGIWNVKQPGYDDKADIQAALKLFLYGDYNFNTDASESAQETALATNNGVARHLQDLKNRIEVQEDLGIGSDYITISQIQSMTSPTDGFIAMASDSTGAGVQSTYGVALYQNDAPTTNLIDGIIWVDKDSENKDVYVYDDGSFVKFGTYTNAKGDLVIGSSQGETQILSVGDNGKVLTADSTAPLGISWTNLDYENNKNISSIYFGNYEETSLIGIHLNGVLENDPLKTIDSNDLELSVIKSASSTKTKISFTGICRPTTDTNTEAFVGLQRKINAGSYSTINIGLVPKEFVNLHFEWIDSHGATTGDTITYRLINITPNGYSSNVITQRIGETSDTFVVEEI